MYYEINISDCVGMVIALKLDMFVSSVIDNKFELD